MNYSDPEILAIILLLPSLVGLSLINEGFNKMKESKDGCYTLIIGLFFVGTVIGIYLYYSILKYL